MGVKYYTHFLLRELSRSACGEFSGVVEVERYSRKPLEMQEIRDMLAENLAVPSEEVEVLHWARLH